MKKQKPPKQKVWVLIIDHSEGPGAQVFTTQAKAHEALVDWVEEWWDRETNSAEKPADQDEMIAEYFEATEEEAYSIAEVTVDA
jgi:hypothetical protein